MLGFATVDLLASDSTLTVWLTSAEDAKVSHTNAVIFDLGDGTAPGRVLGSAADRIRLSMRTTGGWVVQGRSGKSLDRIGWVRYGLRRSGCCTLGVSRLAHGSGGCNE